MRSTREGATAATEPIIPDSPGIENRIEGETLAVLGVVPARLASTRLPRKVLREIAGRPLLAWVVEAAMRCAELNRVVIATDADEVMRLCDREGWPCELTASNLASGTDRLHVVAQRIAARIYVNIQGDEPMLRPEHISRSAAAVRAGSG